MTTRGRPSNALLSVLGALFIASGVILFGYLVKNSWGYGGPLEYAMGILLLGCAGFGLALIAATHPAVKAALKRWFTRGGDSVHRHEDH